MRRLFCLALCLMSSLSFADGWTLSDISQWARRGSSEDVQRLFEVCTEGDAVLAAAALSALRTVTGQEALEALLAAWQGYTQADSTRLESAALAELRAVYLERPDDVGRLMQESDRPEVRIAVLALQRKLRLASVRNQARAALRADPAAEVRVFSAELLWQLEAEAVLPLLFEVFADEHNPDNVVRLALFARLVAAPAHREASLRLALQADDAALREAALQALAQERPQWAADELWKLVAADRPEQVQRGLAGLAVIGNYQDLLRLIPLIPGLPELAETELRGFLLARGDAACLSSLLSAARDCSSAAIGAACLQVAWNLAGNTDDRQLLRNELDALLQDPRPALCAEAYRLLARLIGAQVDGANDAVWIERGLAWDDVQVQAAAIEAFGARPDQALATKVVALLDAKGTGDAASSALAQAGVAAAPALLAAWPQLASAGRVRAAQLLGGLETHPGASAALLQLLSDSDAVVRLEAADALARASSDAQATRTGLRTALGDDYFAVRSSAVRALSGLAWEGAERDGLRQVFLELVANAEPPELEALAAGLSSLGAVEACQAVCEQPLPAKRRAAAQQLQLLALLGQRAACEPYLLAALEAADEQVAGEAALALSALGSSDGDRVLLALLRDPRPARKHLAVRALRSLRERTGQSFGYDPFQPCVGSNEEAWQAWQQLLDTR